MANSATGRLAKEIWTIAALGWVCSFTVPAAELRGLEAATRYTTEWFNPVEGVR